MKLVLTVAASMLLMALAVAGCDAEAEVSIGGKSLDPAEIEDTVSAGLGEQADLPDPEVDCEGIQDIDVEDGSEFTCTGTAPNGDEFPINVTLTDDEGGYRYEVPPTAGQDQSGGS